VRERRPRLLVTLLALAATAALTAGPLPKLPADRVLPQWGDSPGQVTFSHRNHVDEAAPDCLACHSGVFSLLGRTGSRTDSGIRHAAMERGRQCGACHDGTRASGLEDCAHCHVEK
jgi:c(7)-type cytochrome triheme protein